MKKGIKRFITILILMIMALQMILPICVYATENDYIKYKAPKSGYYYVIYTGFSSGGSDLPNYSAFQHYEEADYYEDIYYVTEVNGEEVINHPTVEYGEKNIPIVWLNKDVIYYRLKKHAISDWFPYTPVTISGKIEATKEVLKDSLKKMVGGFIYSLASGLHFLVGSALGESVTIDDLVFNNYGETNISYFESAEEVGDNRSDLIYGEGKVGGLKPVVNEWYGIFMKIALMGYMVILVYMGIRILLTSTADEKANYKKFFVDWFIGIAILFLFPYVMKYMIEINEAFVETIEANKGFEERVSAPLENVEYDERFTSIVVDNEIEWEKGNDYMSQIAYEAKTTCEPALAIVFMIMTWQLITLIFHYYKRLFMIAFLIIIFPLVVLSYAIDKIADGKSQAFNTWLKEYMLNVFVQTFHAIVYVFICTTVYSASGMTDTGGYDFILIIVGVSFLFKGEEIIRQIFGQVSSAGTMKNLSATATATFAKITFATGLVKGVGEYTVGKKSVPRKLVKGVNELRAANARMKAFDKTATTQEDYNTGMRLEHAPEVPGKNATEEEKKNFLKERGYFNAAAVLNNPKSHSQQEKARALNTLKELAVDNPNHDVFKDTKMTVGQIAAMAALDGAVQNMISSGMSRLDIEREVTVRMGVVFSNDTEEERRDKINTYYTAMFLNGTNNSVSRNMIRKEINGIIDESKAIRSNIALGTHSNKLDEVETDVAGDAYEIFSEYGRGANSVAEEDSIKGLALNIARLNRSSSGAYNEKELLDIADYVREHQDDNDLTRKIVEQEFGIDIDMFIHSLAKKVVEESDSDEAIKIAKEEIENYETNSREGYFDDEISVHEVLKDEENEEELNKMIEELYQTKQGAIKDATEDFAKQYLVDNEVDIMEGSYDTSLRTQDGVTEAELLAMKIEAIGQTLSNLGAINKENGSDGSGGILGWAMKEYLAREEEKRTGIKRSIEEQKRVNDLTITAKDYIEKNREERDRIQSEHFLGDIGDRK